jgi:hypothetical protein
LDVICKLTEQRKTIKLKEIFEILAGRGYAALFVILSLPFCIPIQIPGVSTPFGLLLAFLGLRHAFAQRLWWPQWILEKEVSSEKTRHLMEKGIHFFEKHKKFLSFDRLKFVTQNALFHRINGILIFFLGLLLSLPLPIPMTNLLSAVPILLIGIGLLEDDGLFILLGYFLAFVCFFVFILLFYLGKAVF